MDIQQYEIACAIVDQDCTGRGRLRDGDGNFCVLGGLYTALNPDWAEHGRSVGELVLEAIRKAFDLSPTDITRLVWANDHNDELAARRHAVKEVLRNAVRE